MRISTFFLGKAVPYLRPLAGPHKSLLNRRAQSFTGKIREHDPVDKKCRRGFDPGAVAVFHTRAHDGFKLARIKLGVELFPIKPGRTRILLERTTIDRVLVLDSRM